MRRGLVLLLLASCGKSEVVLDATTAVPAVDAPEAAETEPGSTTTTPRVPPPPPIPKARITLTLRSTPPGAAANVDGRPVGQTPVLYTIDADGKPHEFTFVMPGYAPWRVRFPPVKDGVVHATLAPVRFTDAGP